MIVFMHVVIALSSLVASTLTAFSPTKMKLLVSNGLITLTLVSGTILVAITHQPILRSCLTGIIYLAVAMTGVLVGQHRLIGAKEKINTK